MLLAQRGGDGTAAWQHRVTLRSERDQLAQGGAVVGAGVLDPFLDRAAKAADSWSGVRAGAIGATTTLGTAHDHRPALMTDDSADTFYWTSAPPQPGDAIGLDLGSGRPLGTVTVLMGSWGDGPDARSASGDFLHEGVLEYTTGEGGWKELTKVRGRQDITATAPAGVVAKAVRLRATSGQKTAVAVREFSIAAPGETPASVTGGPVAAPAPRPPPSWTATRTPPTGPPAPPAATTPRSPSNSAHPGRWTGSPCSPTRPSGPPARWRSSRPTAVGRRSAPSAPAGTSCPPRAARSARSG